MSRKSVLKETHIANTNMYQMLCILVSKTTGNVRV